MPDNNLPSTSRSFTLRQLLVGVGLIAMLFSLLVSALAAWRASERRAKCTRNLHNWAVACQVYCDVHNHYPALAKGHREWSWNALLAPYMFGSTGGRFAIFHAPVRLEPDCLEAVHMIDDSFVCPERCVSRERTCQLAPFVGAQPTDYIAVSTSRADRVWSPLGDGIVVYNRTSLKATAPVCVRITPADVTDGLSYSAIVGEKHMRTAWLGGRLDPPAMVAYHGSPTVRLAGDRAGNRTLASGPEDADEWKFGSWHKGVSHFALADGSVRALTLQTDPALLGALLSRNDGRKSDAQ